MFERIYIVDAGTLGADMLTVRRFAVYSVGSSPFDTRREITRQEAARILRFARQNFRVIKLGTK
jgi:hypothetical protein